MPIGYGLAGGRMGYGLAQSAGAAAGVDWSTWFDHLWIAKGAASLAASYADLVGGQTLTTLAAPTLDASGWVFAGAAYLDTGISIGAAEAESWSYMVQYSDWAAPVGFEPAFGAYNVSFVPDWFGGSIAANNGGSYANFAPRMLAGNYAIAGLSGYRSGVLDGALNAFAGQGASNMCIGCLNVVGALSRYAVGKVQAFGIKHAIWTAPQVAAAYAALAAL